MISISADGGPMIAKNRSKRSFNVMTGSFNKRAKSSRLEDFFKSNEDFLKLMGDYDGLPLNLKWKIKWINDNNIVKVIWGHSKAFKVVYTGDLYIVNPLIFKF